MKKNIFLLFALTSFFKMDAQSIDDCGTEPLDSVSFTEQPWFGNNQYLLDLLEDVDAEYGVSPSPLNSQYQDIPILG